MIVNQWVPAAHRGDAVGDSARRMRALLRAMGHDSELYALTIDDDLSDDVRPFADPAAERGDVTILHYALPSPMTEALAHLQGGRVLQYHNVTPASFFAPTILPSSGWRSSPGRTSPRSSDGSTWRSASRNTTAGSSRRWVSGRRAC